MGDRILLYPVHFLRNSPVSTIKTIACSRGRNKKMARELTSKENVSAAKKEVSTRINDSSTRGRGTAKENVCTYQVTTSVSCICPV
jgi:hypothetical protein